MGERGRGALSKVLVSRGHGSAHLKEGLQSPVQDAHAPPQEEEEGDHELQEVVAECLQAVEPPGQVMQEVGHRVRHWLCLQDKGTVDEMKALPPSPQLSHRVWLGLWAEPQGSGVWNQAQSLPQ